MFGLRNPMDGPEITQDGPDYEPPEPAEREVTIETEKAAPKAYISKMKNGSIAGFRYFDLTESTHIAVTVRGAGGVLELCHSIHSPCRDGRLDNRRSKIRRQTSGVGERAPPGFLPAVFPV